MLELIFVIIIVGILAKFGTDLYLQIYEGYARSLYINELQTKSAAAIQTLANRLRYRIKDSLGTTTMTSTSAGWQGLDIDSWRDGSWSGIIDIDNAGTDSSSLVSPSTSALGQKKLFFIGSNIDNSAGQYYDVTVNNNKIDGNFTGRDVYEYYQLIDANYSVSFTGSTLTLNKGGTNYTLCDDVDSFNIWKEGDGIGIELCLAKQGNPLVGGTVCKKAFIF